MPFCSCMIAVNPAILAIPVTFATPLPVSVDGLRLVLE